MMLVMALTWPGLIVSLRWNCRLRHHRGMHGGQAALDKFARFGSMLLPRTVSGSVDRWTTTTPFGIVSTVVQTLSPFRRIVFSAGLSMGNLGSLFALPRRSMLANYR
jgi:hypothetical protein